jgi:DNA-binding NarL/FixJ family response regulator
MPRSRCAMELGSRTPVDSESPPFRSCPEGVSVVVFRPRAAPTPEPLEGCLTLLVDLLVLKGCVATATEACLRDNPDVLILASAPNGHVRDAKRFRDAGVKTPVLALREDFGAREAAAMARGLLSGVLPWEAKPSALLSTIQKLTEGNLWVASGVRLVGVASGDTRDRFGAAGLSKREAAVMELVLDGFSSREIARRTCLSASSVDTYRSRAMRKLGAGNLLELARIANDIHAL